VPIKRIHQRQNPDDLDCSIENDIVEVEVEIVKDEDITTHIVNLGIWLESLFSDLS